MRTTNMKHLPVLLLFCNRFLAQFLCPGCHMACIIGGLEVAFFFKIVKNMDRKLPELKKTSNILISASKQ